MTDNDPIADLEASLNVLWARTGADSIVKVPRQRLDEGYPRVKARDNAFDIIITERGKITEMNAGLSKTEALRWLLFSLIEARAQTIELRERKAPALPLETLGYADNGYSRWNWMAPSIRMMTDALPEFGQWASEKYERVLMLHPLDEAEIRNARYPLPE